MLLVKKTGKTGRFFHAFYQNRKKFIVFSFRHRRLKKEIAEKRASQKTLKALKKRLTPNAANHTSFSEASLLSKAIKPQLAFFWAGYCESCKRIMPVFEEIAKKDKGVGFVAVSCDDDENHLLMKQGCGLSVIPSLGLFVNGKIKDTIAGPFDEKEIDALLDEQKESTESYKQITAMPKAKKPRRFWSRKKTPALTKP